MNELPRGSGLLAQYEEYIENRGILDQVLDDCRKQSEQIQKELEAIQDGLPDQPQSLNPSYVLPNAIIRIHILQVTGTHSTTTKRSASTGSS